MSVLNCCTVVVPIGLCSSLAVCASCMQDSRTNIPSGIIRYAYRQSRQQQSSPCQSSYVVLSSMYGLGGTCGITAISHLTCSVRYARYSVSYGSLLELPQSSLTITCGIGCSGKKNRCTRCFKKRKRCAMHLFNLIWLCPSAFHLSDKIFVVRGIKQIPNDRAISFYISFSCF